MTLEEMCVQQVEGTAMAVRSVGNPGHNIVSGVGWESQIPTCPDASGIPREVRR